MVEMKIPGMAYTVRLLQKTPDNYEVIILLHGQPETSTRARLLDRGSIRRAIATALRQIGVSVSELSLDNVARGLLEAAETEGFTADFEAVSSESVLDSFKEVTNERLEQIEGKLEEVMTRITRIEERLGL